STAAEGLPRIGRTSIATHWRSCGLPQSASCSENFVIPPDVFGQTLRNLRAAESRLLNDVNERTTTYVTALEQRERTAIEARRREIHEDPDFQRATEKQKSCNQEFQNLRQVNDGGFPKNIVPVLYVIPLILVGVAEWYVNFSTFAAMFIPVFAIAATIIVAGVFAWARHLQSVRKHQAGLQSFRSMRRIEASRRNASALRLRFSQSLASLRQRLSQAKVRSTTQRRGSTTNPLVRSERLTISVSS